MLLLMLVVVAATSAVIVTQMSEARLRMERGNDTQLALAAARRALLEYAVTYPDRFPGQPIQFPCPDLDAAGGLADGEAHTAACGSPGVSMLGRVPWRTLGIDPPRDTDGNCLWYAVSGSYKGAAAATAALINPDSNGQFQLYSAETGGLVLGAQPEDRAVAIVLAPGAALAGQARSGAGNGTTECGNDFAVADYLDTATSIGVSNATLSGLPYSIETFAVSERFDAVPNDSLLAISRADVESVVLGRNDQFATMAALTAGVASCVAAYGLSNPGGAADYRLPWPAPLDLPDYADALQFNDHNGGQLFGRLADTVNDSNNQTGNAVGRLLTDCDPALAAAWDPALLSLWQHWKDHLFYAVAESYQPTSAVPTVCGNCLSFNSGGSLAAVVLFAGARLDSLNQVRNAPPTDADTRHDITNYLEGRNAANYPFTSGVRDFESRPPAADFNDLAYCIDESMGVGPC